METSLSSNWGWLWTWLSFLFLKSNSTLSLRALPVREKLATSTGKISAILWMKSLVLKNSKKYLLIWPSKSPRPTSATAARESQHKSWHWLTRSKNPSRSINLLTDLIPSNSSKTGTNSADSKYQQSSSDKSWQLLASTSQRKRIRQSANFTPLMMKNKARFAISNSWRTLSLMTSLTWLSSRIR